LRKTLFLRLPVLRHRIDSLWRYYRRSETVYDVHSPYLSDLLAATWLDDRSYYAFTTVEQVRYFWTRQKHPVPLTELGAGSRSSSTRQMTTRHLARHVAIPPATGRFLFRLANFLRPDVVVELGTNLGLSTLYLHLSDRRRTLYTVEGNRKLVELAQQSWQLGGARPTLQPYFGTFAEILPELVAQVPQIGLLFLDGDHRAAATLDYFETALPKLGNDSVVVVGDIHWSPGMEKAWEQLKAHERVRASLDLYNLGLLFFRREFTHPEHHTLIRQRYKPWRMGFFQ
jgi:predicted O-methyltransferase YrrM